MSSWKALSIDDDAAKLDEIKRILERGFKGSVSIVTEQSFEAGLERIDKEVYDFVILDLQDDGDDGRSGNDTERKGEQLLDNLKTIKFLPVIFYTGHPNKVRHLENPMIQVVEKGSGIEELRDSVQSLIDSKLLHVEKYIREQSRALMWESLVPALEGKWGGISSRELVMVYAKNLHKKLSDSYIKELVEVDSRAIDPFEIYTFPGDDEYCDPCDIYKKKSDNSLWMVLTPACDFEQENAERILLSRVIPITEHPRYSAWIETYQKHNGSDVREDKKQINTAKDAVRQLVRGKGGERYRFLPKTFFIDDAVIDFQSLAQVSSDMKHDYELVCSIESPFREELLTAFSKYYGRIGTPDYSWEPIWERINMEFSESM